MSKLTKGQQFFSDRSLGFAQEIYNQNESKINDILKDQKSNRDDILTKIAKTLLSYNISNNVLSLSTSEKAKLYLQLSDLITEKIKSELKNETEATKGILTDVANNKYDTNNYIYSLGKDFNITQLADKQLDEVINKKLKGELWSDRIYANKNAIAKDLKLQVKKFLKGDINVNGIENVIKTKYNVNATNASRLVNTEITRVQSDANEVWAQEHDIKYQMFMATLDSRTSQICREHDGKVYAVDDPDKPIPPLHPNCRSVLVNLVSEDWKPKMRLDNETKRNIDWQSYQEWTENKINSGALSGALNPDGKEAEAHAIKYYESVRHMKTDIDKISKNTGFSTKVITTIKNHVFFDEHNLGYGVTGRFDPDYDMARTWQRIIEGKEIKDMDIIMLKHEYLESGLMKRYNYEYRVAHDITERKYNYSKAVKAERGGQ